MMAGITKRQHDCLTWIRAYISENGHSPSYREIGQGIGCKATSNVYRLVVALQKRGHVDFLKARARSIHVRGSES